MKKKVFIVGNSLSAVVLAQKLSKQCEVYITSYSDLWKDFAECVDIRETNSAELLDFVMENGIDMTIVTSQLAIKNDIANLFLNNKQAIFAPTALASSIATDKVKAKKTLYKLRIQTPKFGIFDKQNMANDYLKNQKTPFVIKTNEIASSVIITSAQTAKNIVDSVFIDKNKKIIIEDYVYGTPFSFYAITDGYKALPIGSSIIYKHSLDGDGGQLTEGMGACSPNYRLSLEQEYFIMDNVIYPTIEYLESENVPYLGIIGVNGIISNDGVISILGWLPFLQDCDAASVLEIIDENLYKLFDSCILGSFSDEVESITLKDAYAVSLVLKNKNKTNIENVITGIENLEEDTLFCLYPTVKKNKYLEYEAETGNVATLTCVANSVARASEKVYSEANEINFNGIFYRKDICRPYK